MRRLTLATAIALTATAVAGPIPKGKPVAKVSNYFPCELYTKWEYECGKSSTVVEVTKVRHEKDCKIVTMTHTDPSTGAKSTSTYRVTTAGVREIGSENNRIALGLMLKFPQTAGDSWIEELDRLGTAVIVVREPTTVEVPAGKFKVIGTSLTVRGVQVDHLQLTNFYADGVGRVMTPAVRPGQPPSVLKKFSPPPK